MNTFEKAKKLLDDLQFSIIDQDMQRPWGGFFVIDEDQAASFVRHFFPEEDIEQLKLSAKLSPKILVVAPHKRLSWQYHNRRAEIWRCVDGHAGVVTSLTDIEGERQILNPGDIVRLQQGERHRLMGLNEWCIVAEIWQHTGDSHPSDENDIIRLQDDFGRQPNPIATLS
ncbi:MAG: phosphoheptose isomerase [Bacteroidia bacterium]|nr:phosphoheptose isomerase [Bacteroidia bacterium]